MNHPIIDNAVAIRKYQVARAVACNTPLPDVLISVVVDHVIGSELDAATKIAVQYWNLRDRCEQWNNKYHEEFGPGAYLMLPAAWLRELVQDMYISSFSPYPREEFAVYQFMFQPEDMASYFKRHGQRLIQIRKSLRQEINEIQEYIQTPLDHPILEITPDMYSIDFN